MMHFTDAELIRWSETGPGADRDRVIAHLALCASCAARYGAAMRARSLDASDMPTDGSELRRFIDAARAVAPQPARVVRWRRRAVWVGAPLAAAAAIVLAIAVARHGADTGGDTAPALRGATLHALAPDGEAAAGARFEWASGVAAARYRITVGGPAGPFYSTFATGSPLPIPGDLRPQLTPGSSYWWTVTALDASSRVIVVSERRTFTLTR